MKDFVKYDLALRLKEKGFITTEPFAIYQLEDIDTIYPLYTSDPYYYDLDDFDEYSFVAPTISQVLKWLREDNKLYIGVTLYQYLDKYKFYPTIQHMDKMEQIMFVNNDVYSSYEEAALAGIKYVLDNLI